MICFQFLFFVFLMTTTSAQSSSSTELWFAFNFCSLYFWWQLSILNVVQNYGCDLLSIFVLCIFDDNLPNFAISSRAVVICFQFLFFVFLMTTSGFGCVLSRQLWFAFNFCSLYFWWQPCADLPVKHSSCDLLSIFVLCIFDDNYLLYFIVTQMVVICFQFLFFVFLMTT